VKGRGKPNEAGVAGMRSFASHEIGILIHRTFEERLEKN
jgi:hypothetical protein